MLRLEKPRRRMKGETNSRTHPTTSLIFNRQAIKKQTLVKHSFYPPANVKPFCVHTVACRILLPTPGMFKYSMETHQLVFIPFFHFLVQAAHLTATVAHSIHHYHHRFILYQLCVQILYYKLHSVKGPERMKIKNKYKIEHKPLATSNYDYRYWKMEKAMRLYRLMLLYVYIHRLCIYSVACRANCLGLGAFFAVRLFLCSFCLFPWHTYTILLKINFYLNFRSLFFRKIAYRQFLCFN